MNIADHIRKAMRGDVVSCFNLGCMYHSGLGAPQNYAAAVEWYELAARRGFLSAQVYLARMFHHGDGVPVDIKAAVKWYTKAAKQGDAGAQYELGYMYDDGDVVPRDKEAAEYWYSSAAEQGHAVAQYRLGWLYFFDEPRIYILAHMWFSIAALNRYKLPTWLKGNIEKCMTPAEIKEAKKLAADRVEKWTLEKKL